jgi:hypothetical protein
MNRRRITAALLGLAASLPQARGAETALTLLGEDQPRAFFFRQAEGLAAARRMPYEQWERNFGRLMGVMGKVLDEEVPGRSRGLDYFVRFKRAHPEQTVLLHLNGNARDPRYEGGRFFAGHWLYHNGVTLTAGVPAAAGETTLHVSDATPFEVGGGRYRNSNDDLGLCMLGPDGRPDWSRSEQVQLLALDRRAKTLRVRRGCYGTAPRAFAAGAGYVAAHCVEGPWGKESNLLWAYNYATTCPRDTQGRTAADVYVAHLAELFGPGGALVAFDGLEFDVLFNAPGGANAKRRGADADADGRRDDGVVGGVNVYGNGVTAFCAALRAALGEGRLIMADGAFRGDREQRAVASLNGIESEGWPVLGDFHIDDWSGGLNRHAYWQAFGHRPALSYANIKFVEHGETPGDTAQAKVGFNSVRLAMAGAVLTDSAVTFAHRPDAPGGGIAIWDELVAGTEARPGWLGRALGPARHLADESPDLLAGATLADQLTSDDATIKPDGGTICIAARTPAAQSFTVRLRALPANRPDLTVVLAVRSAAMAATASEVPRLVHARLVAGPEGKAVGLPLMSWTGRPSFVSRFYFRKVPAGPAEIRLTFESAEPVWVERLSVHAASDGVVRSFANGVVLANPSDQPQEFALGVLAPAGPWRRLQASAGQDVATNNGTVVGGRVTLPARDALFLRR